jgi:dTDP-4-amino-4,6-dideoxygalactose transaminase
MAVSSSAHIFFNRPHVAGKEAEFVQHVLASRKFSGDGVFTHTCEQFFEQKFGFGKAMLTTSCTDALEMAALLLDIGAGDEVIIPSYTFVSTANAFALRGAKIVFADSSADHPNIDVQHAASLVTAKTKAIVAVHYAGMACDMDALGEIAASAGIHIVEDAAHAIDSRYKEKFLGSIGSIGTLSFHETKNITCGEGGLIAVNDPSLRRKAEIVREKGTNRKAFSRGETDRYSWVGLGSSFLPSEFSAAILAAQLEECAQIQQKRVQLWNRYNDNLKALAAEGKIGIPAIPEGATVNGHLYYIMCNSLEERTGLMKYLSANGVDAVFHYLSLHSSPYFTGRHDGRALPNSDRFMYCLLRLPMYYDLETADVDRVCERISQFYKR